MLNPTKTLLKYGFLVGKNGDGEATYVKYLTRKKDDEKAPQIVFYCPDFKDEEAECNLKLFLDGNYCDTRIEEYYVFKLGNIEEEINWALDKIIKKSSCI